MKYYFLAAALLALFSCKKHDNDFVPEADLYRELCPAGYDSHEITGKWRKLASYNGMTGQPEPATANTYVVLTLHANKTYTTTVNGQVTNTGHYDTATITGTLSHTQQQALIFDNNAVLPMIVHTFHDSLSLSADVYDGGGNLYRRDCR